MSDEFDLSGDLEAFEVFPWNPSFETGNSLIDRQHKKLVNLLNGLANSFASDQETNTDQAFKDLAEYAQTHFKDEEKLWRDAFGDDAWSRSHQKIHKSFLTQVIEIKDRASSANHDQVVEELLKFLIRWLATHIIENDKRMSFVVTEIKNGTSLEKAKHRADDIMAGSMGDLVEAVLSMYESLSATALDMIRERNARLKAEGRLKDAYKEMETLSNTDQLTGLFNRRHLLATMQLEIARAARNKEELAFYMLDVDFFKKYNDMYGHLTGDEALKGVAAALRFTCRRPGDFVFRYGGEEFCVLVTGANAQNIEAFGDKIRASVEALAIPHAGNENGQVLTVSVGAAGWTPKQSDNMDDYIGAADKALYDSKSTGRNKVTLQDRKIGSPE